MAVAHETEAGVSTEKEAGASTEKAHIVATLATPIRLLPAGTTQGQETHLATHIHAAIRHVKALHAAQQPAKPLHAAQLAAAAHTAVLPEAAVVHTAVLQEAVVVAVLTPAHTEAVEATVVAVASAEAVLAAEAAASAEVALAAVAAAAPVAAAAGDKSPLPAPPWGECLRKEL